MKSSSSRSTPAPRSSRRRLASLLPLKRNSPCPLFRPVNPRNNLAHCFCCKKNLNNIDLLITLDYDFRSAVALVSRWLNDNEAQQAKSK